MLKRSPNLCHQKLTRFLQSYFKNAYGYVNYYGDPNFLSGFLWPIYPPTNGTSRRNKSWE
jgi:hypothetical protein